MKIVITSRPSFGLEKAVLSQDLTNEASATGAESRASRRPSAGLGLLLTAELSTIAPAVWSREDAAWQE